MGIERDLRMQAERLRHLHAALTAISFSAHRAVCPFSPPASFPFVNTTRVAPVTTSALFFGSGHALREKETITMQRFVLHDTVCPPPSFWRRVSWKNAAALILSSLACVAATPFAPRAEFVTGSMSPPGTYPAFHGTREAHTVQGVPFDKLPRRTRDEATREAAEGEDIEKDEESIYTDPPVDPTAVYPNAPINPPTTAKLPTRALAPGDFAFFRISQPGTGTPGTGLVYWPNEPTAAENGRVCFYAGNVWARLSGDHGQTWVTIDPTTLFPTADSGVTGDFVTYYERTHEIMIWYLQYKKDPNQNNIQRLAVAVGQDNLANSRWTYWDFSAASFGFPSGRWLDYPDMAVTDSRLYITTNVISNGSLVGTVIYRLNLDELAAQGTVHYDWIAPLIGTSSWASLRLVQGVQGTTTTMYAATHVDNNTLRIYTWLDGSSSMTSVDRDVTAWQTGTSSASSPDGTNWLAADKHRVLGAWLAGNRIGFMWDSAQGGGYTWPNVRWARFDFTLNLADQGTIWNGAYAWAYPSAHRNDAQAVGGTIHVGGGNPAATNAFPYPTPVAWISDAYNSFGLLGDAVAFDAGAKGPVANRYGDYCSTRMHDRYSLTWIGTGYALTGNGNSNSDYRPDYVWFGRLGDAPPSTFTIYVDKYATSWQNGDGGHPYHTIAAGVFATVPGDNVSIRSGTYHEATTFDRGCTMTTSGGTVTIQP
jgi:hypothetical protein